MRKGTCGWVGAPLVTSPTIHSYSKSERILGTPSTIPTEPSESGRTTCFSLDISSRRLLQSVTIRRRRQIQPSESPQRPPPRFGLAEVGRVWGAALEEGKKSILGLGSKSCRLSFPFARSGWGRGSSVHNNISNRHNNPKHNCKAG